MSRAAIKAVNMNGMNGRVADALASPLMLATD